MTYLDQERKPLSYQLFRTIDGQSRMLSKRRQARGYERATVDGGEQGGKRPGGETGSPLLVQCVMRRRTGTSAPSALPVR